VTGPALLCFACGVPLEPRRTAFTYLDHAFTAEVPRCPRCGQVFISEELARGRIKDAEMQLEDK
jgi:predicted RNA-binding Zn-ribbon protein involved in translation (DUF1610 family)